MFSLCMFLASIYAYGQGSGPSIDIYSVALVEAAKEMKRDWGSLSQDQSRIPIDYKAPVILKDESVKADYPTASTDNQFEYCTWAELFARRRKLRKDFAILRIHPATVEGLRVKVVVSQDWISIVRGKPSLAISAWASVFFRVDSETGQFRVDEVRLGGI